MNPLLNLAVLYVLPLHTPEVFSHPYSKGFLQSAALNRAYVQFRPAIADYSIGFFQMEQIPIQLLEEELRRYALAANYQEILSYPHPQVAWMRSEQVQRLSTEHCS